MASMYRRVPVDTGEVIGKYALGRRLGAGGMGAVYEAYRDGKAVAIKLPYCETLESDYARRRFVDEGIAGSIVNHKNVARIYEHGETAAGVPYLVMEHVAGVRLCERLAHDRAMSLRRAAMFVQQILDGLDALHAAGIIHGDVKTDNVLVTMIGPDEVAKLIDFGLAHPELDGHRTREPRTGEMVAGTPDFMAPEVIRGEGSTVASDIYAAGVVLYELLTGTTPFAGGTSADIVRRHLTEPVLPPSLREPERAIPPILERIVMRALEKDPLARFASAAAFASALAIAIPALCDDELASHIRCANDRPTLDWQHAPRRRIARGTPRARRPR